MTWQRRGGGGTGFEVRRAAGRSAAGARLRRGDAGAGARVARRGEQRRGRAGERRGGAGAADVRPIAAGSNVVRADVERRGAGAAEVPPPRPARVWPVPERGAEAPVPPQASSALHGSGAQVARQRRHRRRSAPSLAGATWSVPTSGSSVAVPPTSAPSRLAAAWSVPTSGAETPVPPQAPGVLHGSGVVHARTPRRGAGTASSSGRAARKGRGPCHEGAPRRRCHRRPRRRGQMRHPTSRMRRGRRGCCAAPSLLPQCAGRTTGCSRRSASPPAAEPAVRP
jgi:hypothetical protein